MHVPQQGTSCAFTLSRLVPLATADWCACAVSFLGLQTIRIRGYKCNLINLEIAVVP